MKIRICNLSKTFGFTRALDDISLTIEPGTLVTLIGLNGAGKTTLLRALATIVSPTGGDIFYDGQPLRRDRIDLRRRLMFLPDFPPVFANMTPLEHILFTLRVYEADRQRSDDRILDVLEQLDLLPYAETPTAKLSRGQIYKAALAALIVTAPGLWLLDEPFASGLDPQGIAVLKHYIRATTKAGGTVIYSTQILEIAARFTDQLAVLDGGHLRQFFSGTDLAAMPPDGPDSLESRLRQFREVQTPV